MAPGRGVRISEASKVWIGSPSATPTSAFRVRGILGFGPGRIVGGEIVRTTASGKRFRFRVASGVTYGSGGAWSHMLPPGKRWAVSSSLRLKPYQLSEQNIDIFEPAALQKVLTTTRSVTPGQVVNGAPTTRHAGVIPVKALCAVSMACRETLGSSNAYNISWQIWVNRRGHIVRVFTRWAQAPGKGGPGGGSEVNTYYGYWGSKVTIKAPLPNEVARVS
ncbi:hypothetical protein GCM10017673_09630 [Streptosporangium violaceochromogenes]|nr:hypothetical protein GCM10017673_09630 [Streptosporangium violaceochromogenes]